MPLIKCNIAGHEKADTLGRNAKHSQSVIYISRFDLSNRLRKKSYSMLTTYTLNRREIKTRQCIRRVITARKYNNNYKRMACGAMEASDYMKNLERGSESMTRFGETS